MKFKTPKFVIFDMDGLILDTEQLFMEQKSIVMERYGYIQKRDDYTKTIGTGGEILRQILLEMYGEDYPMEKISSETRKLVNEWIEVNGPPVKKGIPELMEYLQNHNIPMCVATTTDSLTAETYMEQAGLASYLQFVVGGEMVRRSKPDPEIFLTAVKKSGVIPEDCLVIEDSPNGIRAAQNANIPVIVIPDMLPVPLELKEYILAEVSTADRIIELLNDLDNLSL